MNSKILKNRNIHKRNTYGAIGKLRESKDKVIQKIRRDNLKQKQKEKHKTCNYYGGE